MALFKCIGCGELVSSFDQNCKECGMAVNVAELTAQKEAQEKAQREGREPEVPVTFVKPVEKVKAATSPSPNTEAKAWQTRVEQNPSSIASALRAFGAIFLVSAIIGFIVLLVGSIQAGEALGRYGGSSLSAYGVVGAFAVLISGIYNYLLSVAIAEILDKVRSLG